MYFLVKAIHRTINRTKKKAKNKFENDSYKVMKNVPFGKTMEIVKKHKNIKLVTSRKRRKYFVCEPNYKAYKRFSEKMLAIEMWNAKIKPVYICFPIFNLIKTNPLRRE